MAPTEQGGSRLGPAESGDESHEPGDAPGESRRLSQAFVYPFAGWWCSELGCGLLNLPRSCPWWLFYAALALSPGCCSASGGLQWLGGCCVV